jgi:cell division septation protein DedD
MTDPSENDIRRSRIIGGVFLAGVVLVFAPFLFDADPVQQGYVQPEDLPGRYQQPAPVEDLPGRYQQPAPVEDSYAPPPVRLEEDVLALAEPLREETDEAGYRTATGERFGEPTFLPANDPRAQSWSSWGVQVGSFGDVDNAHELRALLRGEGHHISLSEVRASGEILTRVAAGPVLREEDARRMQKEFSEKHGLDTILVKFET